MRQAKLAVQDVGFFRCRRSPGVAKEPAGIGKSPPAGGLERPHPALLRARECFAVAACRRPWIAPRLQSGEQVARLRRM